MADTKEQTMENLQITMINLVNKAKTKVIMMIQSNRKIIGTNYFTAFLILSDHLHQPHRRHQLSIQVRIRVQAQISQNQTKMITLENNSKNTFLK